MRLATLNILLIGAALCGAQASAAPAEPGSAAPLATLGKVDVESLSELDEKPYGKLFKGMALFDKYHHMAPAAVLRFRLYPRTAGVALDGLVVKLLGDKTNLPVALNSDLGFSLPQDARAANDDAYVSTNRKAKSFAWRVDIRSPGVPPNMRRLGDLRLECKIDLMAAELAPGIKPPAFYALLAAGVDPCNVRTVSVGYFAERPLFGVSMVAGARRQELPAFTLFGSKSPALFAPVFDWILLRDRFYVLPIWDASWPDDTLVELEYVDDGPGARAPGIEATIEAGPGGAQ